MLKIRLRRVGAKKQPSYRVVVADSRSPRDGRLVEVIGFYNPRTDPPTVNIEEERALYWLSRGAQPTEAVAGFLKSRGTLDRFARLKRGEDLEDLLQEAAAAEQVPVPETPPPTEEEEQEVVVVEEEEEEEDEAVEEEEEEEDSEQEPSEQVIEEPEDTPEDDEGA
jgi:small subunit ribosomal protein S16